MGLRGALSPEAGHRRRRQRVRDRPGGRGRDPQVDPEAERQQACCSRPSRRSATRTPSRRGSPSCARQQRLGQPARAMRGAEGPLFARRCAASCARSSASTGSVERQRACLRNSGSLGARGRPASCRGRASRPTTAARRSPTVRASRRARARPRLRGGRFGRPVPLAQPRRERVGADIEQSAEVADRTRTDAEFVTFDGTSLPFDDASFDLVYCKQVLGAIPSRSCARPRACCVRADCSPARPRSSRPSTRAASRTPPRTGSPCRRGGRPRDRRAVPRHRRHDAGGLARPRDAALRALVAPRVARQSDHRASLVARPMLAPATRSS